MLGLTDCSPSSGAEARPGCRVQGREQADVG